MLEYVRVNYKNIHSIRVTFVDDFLQLKDQPKNKTYKLAFQLLDPVHFLALIHHCGKWSVVILLRSFTFNNYQLCFYKLNAKILKTIVY